MNMSYYGWKPYVPVAVRKAKAAREMQKLAKKGQTISPVRIEGRTIARTFWGKAWCENLERYSDYENRLPRGRTYVRNGSVVDLQILPGKIEARVSGSAMYRVDIEIKPLPKTKWKDLCADCAGAIDSLVELLQGRFSKGVMARICQEGKGLFPSPAEIELNCSCPDWADMCKHVAAVLYGVGARLDEKPELLFLLRGVAEKELLAHAAGDLPLAIPAASANVLEDNDLADLFGLEMAEREADAKPVRETTPKAQREQTPKDKSKPASKKQVEAAAKTQPESAKSAKPRGKPATTEKLAPPKPKAATKPKSKTRIKVLAERAAARRAALKETKKNIARLKPRPKKTAETKVSRKRGG
jgi:uncharacterized Zn finger protein